MARGRTRKQVPWAGWGKEEPKGHERTVMYRKCGRKCFLGPRKYPHPSFPICTKGTCRVNPKGLWAAYIRAKQWGKSPSSYKGMSRPTMRRRVYTGIAGKAKRMLRDYGYEAGRGDARKTRRRGKYTRSGRRYGGRRRHGHRCPKGYAHKLTGQRRRWIAGVDKIVKHGRRSCRCYKKKTRHTRRR